MARGGFSFGTYAWGDVFSPRRALVFIFYRERGYECPACLSYEEYLRDLCEGRLGMEALPVAGINFCESPFLALLFRAISFPSFFLQDGGRFWNLGDFDWSRVRREDVQRISECANDIDVILRNRAVLEKVGRLPWALSPRSPLSLLVSLVAGSLFYAFRAARELSLPALEAAAFFLVSSASARILRGEVPQGGGRDVRMKL